MYYIASGKTNPAYFDIEIVVQYCHKMHFFSAFE